MLEKFINPNQLKTLRGLAQHSEEQEHFQEILINLEGQIQRMPGPGEQSEAVDPICHLHYFGPNSDHWIIERDSLESYQEQAFCFACLGGLEEFAELGYVSIPDLLINNVELDLYFEPKPLSQVKAEGGFR